LERLLRGRAPPVRFVRWLVAERYGHHSAVVAWQTDNEYGCHDTVQSFSAAASAAFRVWLAERYGDIATLKQAWGTMFWSQAYRSFDEIDLPNHRSAWSGDWCWVSARKAGLPLFPTPLSAPLLSL
jgi:beta-galactosidase